MSEQEREREYREQGKSVERRFLACPQCTRAVEAEDGVLTVTCSACEHSFSTETAMTVEADNARRMMVRALEPVVPEDRGMSATTRWALTGGVLGSIVLGSAIFGPIGFMVTFGAALGLASLANAKVGGGRYR